MGSFHRKIFAKLSNRYRLILRRDDNLEEKVSIQLKLSNMVLILSAAFLFFGAIVYILLAYTPFNYIFPVKSAKYSSQEQYKMMQKIDSLEISLSQLDLQSTVLKNVLSGEGLSMDMSAQEVLVDNQEVNNGAHSGEEIQQIIKPSQSSKIHYSFFIPLKGIISDSFNIKRGHLGIDIASKSRDVIKAIQNGTVVFSGWTSKGGHTLIIQHSNNIISVYKHNAVLLKKTGTFVSAGTAIALVGNTGELSSGPHLHFELWENGLAVDPLKYLNL